MNLETEERLGRKVSAVLTIGHSNHLQEYFLDLLIQFGVTALADVRSVPYSRFNPQFNREGLAATLKERGIRYIYLGHQLGGRSEDLSCYDEETGHIRYDLLAKKPQFRNGLRRVLRGAEEYRIALMCAESEPLDCHRSDTNDKLVLRLSTSFRTRVSNHTKLR